MHKSKVYKLRNLYMYIYVCVCMYICVQYILVVVWLLSHVWLLTTPWTVAHQSPPSMGFWAWQEYWSGLPFPPPVDLPNPGIEPESCLPLALASRPFATAHTWEALSHLSTQGVIGAMQAGAAALPLVGTTGGPSPKQATVSEQRSTSDR